MAWRFNNIQNLNMPVPWKLILQNQNMAKILPSMEFWKYTVKIQIQKYLLREVNTTFKEHIAPIYMDMYNAIKEKGSLRLRQNHQ